VNACASGDSTSATVVTVIATAFITNCSCLCQEAESDGGGSTPIDPTCPMPSSVLTAPVIPTQTTHTDTPSITTSRRCIHAGSPTAPAMCRTPGPVTVDGDVSDWDLSLTVPDCFASMHEGSDPDNRILSHSYVRYDRSAKIVYVLVY
jgi:hypothetical protein